MYTIKQIPEDFIVNEVSSMKLSEGPYGYFLLKKRNYTTQAAIEKIASALNIPLKNIGYAGNKDRQAITTQMISIERHYERAKTFKATDIELEFRGTGSDPISLGDLESNSFEIVVRNITKLPKKMKQFVNLFDEQRFSMNNAEIGKMIVKKELKKALESLNNGKYERNAREFFEKTNDAPGALRRIPGKILRLYVHAYQSLLWNQAAEELSKKYKENVDIPLVGFGTEIENKEIQEIYDDIFKEEGITQRDFLIRSIPEISSEGHTRRLYAEIKDLEIGKLEDDELNKGMKKVKISFSLGKGCYATMAIKNMFKGSA